MPIAALGIVSVGREPLPTWLAALHQAGAVLLLTVTLLLYHSLSRLTIVA